MGDPKEIRSIALLLASDASCFMTGAVYPVDGGALAGAFSTTTWRPDSGAQCGREESRVSDHGGAPTARSG